LVRFGGCVGDERTLSPIRLLEASTSSFSETKRWYKDERLYMGGVCPSSRGMSGPARAFAMRLRCLADLIPSVGNF